MPKRPTSRTFRKVELGQLINRRDLLLHEYRNSTSRPTPPPSVTSWDLIQAILDAEFPPAKKRSYLAVDAPSEAIAGLWEWRQKRDTKTTPEPPSQTK